MRAEFVRGAVLDMETDRARARCAAMAATLEAGGLMRPLSISRVLPEGEDGLRKVLGFLRDRGLGASWAYHETDWQPQSGVVVAIRELWMDWRSGLVLGAMDGMTEIPGAGMSRTQRVAHALEMALPRITDEHVMAGRALVALAPNAREALASWMLGLNVWDAAYTNPKRFVGRKKPRPVRAAP